VIVLGWIIFSAIGGSDDEPTPTALPQTITASDGSPMVLIPAGPFTMGSDSGGNDEQPVRTVTLDAFYIDQYEVTNARYSDCVAAGDCNLPFCTGIYNDPDKVNHPVVCVNWERANTYCEWRGGRLPTEAEWEKAARGTDGRIYPWGDTAPNETLLNFNHNVDDTTLVGSYPDGVSPYGVHDMAGNVFEWVADWYNQDYYATVPIHNPQGPYEGDFKVLRGGSWSGYDARVSNRVSRSPDDFSFLNGFRCVADVATETLTSTPGPTNTPEPPTDTPLPLPTPSQLIEPQMILIPAGEFLMGSDPRVDEDVEDNEQPQHTVYLPDYYMAKTPMTWPRPTLWLKSNDYSRPENSAGLRRSPTRKN